MQLLHVVQDFEAGADVLRDLARIEDLWTHARTKATEEGPWLFGRYSLADAFYAPVACRIVGYDLPVSDSARRYCATTLADGAFKAWRAEGLKVTYDPMPYDIGTTFAPWPEPR